MKPTQASLYKPFDEFAEKARKTIQQEMNRLILAPWDELHITQAKRKTEILFKRIDRMNRKAYRELCEWVYEWVLLQYDREPEERDWTKVVDDWLKGYDPVTMYVYDSEMERKRLRLVEGILTAMETQDRQALTEVVRAAGSLLLTQSLQYGLDLMGETERKTFEETDEEEMLVYHACNDSRTCAECHADDGKVFRKSEAPRIPRHYRCRCWYTRATVETADEAD